jgi:chromosome partitioning protein
MGRTIAIFSEKGGVGKSTLAINLGAALAAAGRGVLVIDADSQANASDIVTDGLMLGEDSDLSAVLLDECEAENAVVWSESFGLSIIPAGNRLADTQADMVNLPGRDTRLRLALAGMRDRFDYILIDCPPGRGLLAIAALAAADEVLIPTDPSRGGLVGVQRAIDLANQVRRYCADAARPGAPGIMGVVLNRCQKNKTHQQCAADLAAGYGPLFIATIPQAVAVDASGLDARAIVLMAPTNPAAEAIANLARRIDSHGTANAA